MKKERLDYFDFAKGIGMICIFIYHLYASTMEINVWVRTFAVQLFFVISGALIRYSENKKTSLKEQIIKAFKSLMIPYLFFCLLYDFIEGYQYGINDLFSALKGSILLTPRGALWFLPALFFSELILYFLTNKKINNKVLFIISMVLFWLGMFLTKSFVNQYTTLFIRVCIGFGYLTFGYLIFPLLSKIKINFIILLIVSYILYLISLKNGSTSMFGCYFNNLFYNFIISFSICFFTLLLCKKINYVGLINWIGKNSLIIMCTHQKVIALITSKIINGYPYNSLLNGFFSMILILIIEVLIVNIINKYLPFVLGKRKKTI